VKPADVLKTREGTLTETPLPLLLDAIHREGRTCTLELTQRQLQKRLVFEEGAPVSCTSNLLHETLGKRLVEKGTLTEAQYQAALAESVKTGIQMGELLVQKGWVAPYELYRQLQASLAHKILDCFRWTDARYRLLFDAEAPQSALRMNPSQLVFTGITTVLPFDVVSTQLALTEDQRFAVSPTPPPTTEALKLAAKDQRFLQALKGGVTFPELMAKTNLELEPALRRLYALVLLGLADRVEALENAAAAAPAVAPATLASPAVEAPAPSEPAGIPFSDEDPKLRDAMMSLFLEHRSRDPFALLDVKPDATVLQLRQRFLALADRFSPLRFRTPELREKAEALLLAHARAFATLADPEQRAQWDARRRAAEEKQKGIQRPSAVEQFRIRTDLLDATSQFDQGRKRLQERNPRGALEYFEYACDIDPKPRYRAWRAWARFWTDPERHGRLALQELTALCEEEGATDEVFAFTGELHKHQGRWPEAEACFRRAYKLNPGHKAYADSIQLAMKRGKR
jgi:tetratricopeptide (TPR) repeat protein